MEDVLITPSEVKEFYNNIPRDSLPYLSSEVEVSEIVIHPVANDSSKARSKDKLEKILLRLKAGEKFDELAKFIQTNHSYETPEIIALEANAGVENYLDWMKNYLEN